MMATGSREKSTGSANYIIEQEKSLMRANGKRKCSMGKGLFIMTRRRWRRDSIMGISLILWRAGRGMTGALRMIQRMERESCTLSMAPGSRVPSSKTAYTGKDLFILLMEEKSKANGKTIR